MKLEMKSIITTMMSKKNQVFLREETCEKNVGFLKAIKLVKDANLKMKMDHLQISLPIECNQPKLKE